MLQLHTLGEPWACACGCVGAPLQYFPLMDIGSPPLPGWQASSTVLVVGPPHGPVYWCLGAYSWLLVHCAHSLAGACSLLLCLGGDWGHGHIDDDDDGDQQLGLLNLTACWNLP